MDNRFNVFVNDNADYYERKWRKKYSWNWAAFFLGYFWLGYRRMYRVLLSIVVIQMVIGLLFSQANSDAYDNIIRFITFITGIFLGVYGNKLYKNKAEKTIVHVGNFKLNEQDELREIEQRGGTSIGGIFLAIGIMFASAIIEVMIIASILNL
ncbi:DUF2628 domain-containing protein [Rummeliibacillus pycnus]|uniref:DUF2628 domain-containing protein n=1 Tax=Rummeliibacillus pycnus TaxID=101070 RepID=UPI000C9A2F5E|nr:DUF2628 domain-containing protein [Rummeliibacillus pycnus]